jgi:hypothetical protein
MLHAFPWKTTMLLVASALALASCTHDEVEIKPTPEGSYRRAVVYLDQAKPARHDTVYQSPVLQLSAKRGREGYTIYLLTPNTMEEVGLNIPRAQMPANLVGSYPFRAPISRGQAAYYHYLATKTDKPNGGVATGYDSSWLPSTGAVTGAVNITAYDAKQHVLSGQFQLVLTGVYDPRALRTERITRRCDLTLEGTFTNVPVTDED